ncbi:ferrous iron transport protein A [bacterium]|nr:ferrous iron transport protein A [bacterium]
MNVTKGAVEMVVDLAQMRNGQSGIVVRLQGGYAFIRHVQAMGVPEGKRLTKLASQPLRGPVLVSVDNLQIAIGYGMARRIFLDVD